VISGSGVSNSGSPEEPAQDCPAGNRAARFWDEEPSPLERRRLIAILVDRL
jgi:hypothetical protein